MPLRDSFVSNALQYGLQWYYSLHTGDVATGVNELDPSVAISYTRRSCGAIALQGSVVRATGRAVFPASGSDWGTVRSVGMSVGPLESTPGTLPDGYVTLSAPLAVPAGVALEVPANAGHFNLADSDAVKLTNLYRANVYRTFPSVPAGFFSLHTGPASLANEVTAVGYKRDDVHWLSAERLGLLWRWTMRDWTPRDGTYGHFGRLENPGGITPTHWGYWRVQSPAASAITDLWCRGALAAGVLSAQDGAYYYVIPARTLDFTFPAPS